MILLNLLFRAQSTVYMFVTDIIFQSLFFPYIPYLFYFLLYLFLLLCLFLFIYFCFLCAVQELGGGVVFLCGINSALVVPVRHVRYSSPAMLSLYRIIKVSRIQLLKPCVQSLSNMAQ